MIFKWEDTEQNFTEDFDLFIAFASYEQRCLALARHIPEGKVKQAAIFYLKEFEEYSSDNLTQLKEIFSSKKIENDVYCLSQENPIDSSDKIIECLEKRLKTSLEKRILIDITTFTHEMTLIMLMLLECKFSLEKVTFAYSNAKDYDYLENGTKSAAEKWLSKGISGLRSILGYPGELLPTKQTHLIIIVGYEYDRAISVISEMEPSSLSLGFGKSDSFTAEVSKTENKHYGAKEHFEEVVRDAHYVVPKNKVSAFDVSCNDPKQAYEDIKTHLSQIHKITEDKNIVLFAMNNKISTLGAGLLALEQKEIRLCYAPALIYNYENYSIPGEKCYFLNL